MFGCVKCGRFVEDDELRTERQNLCDNYYEDVIAECACGGEFVEAFRCDVCGDWFITEDGDEPYYKICDNCLDEEQTVSNAIEIGAEDERTVTLNGFLLDAIGIDKINEILSDWAKKNIKDDDLRVFHYCQEDKLFFTEFVANKKGI